MSRACVANADTITTIPKDSLVDYAGVLGAEKIVALDEAIKFALGFD